MQQERATGANVELFARQSQFHFRHGKLHFCLKTFRSLFLHRLYLLIRYLLLFNNSHHTQISFVSLFALILLCSCLGAQLIQNALATLASHKSQLGASSNSPPSYSPTSDYCQQLMLRFSTHCMSRLTQLIYGISQAKICFRCVFYRSIYHKIYGVGGIPSPLSSPRIQDVQYEPTCD